MKVEQLIHSVLGDHEREFKVELEEKDDGWEATLFILAPEPNRPDRENFGDPWDEYAKARGPQRIDVIQTIAHYMVTA
jgi:hypothetical protein